MRVGRRCGELKVCWGPTPQHIFLHLPHFPPHILSPHANTLSHSPHTLSHTLPTLLHSPHIFPYLPPHPNTFPYIYPHRSLPSAPLTSLYTPTHFLIHPMHSPHILPHSFDYVAKLPCDDVTLNEFNSKSPIKFFPATWNLKSCFRVGNVNFRCMKVWRSYHVAKLLWRNYHMAKLLATENFITCIK